MGQVTRNSRIKTSKRNLETKSEETITDMPNNISDGYAEGTHTVYAQIINMIITASTSR